jgi:hypothetical protein
MKSEDVRIGFLAVQSIGDDNSIRGTVIVTDGQTHPLELRYSDAIEVTTLEKIAFGLKLKEGISVSRIALPLIKTLMERPHALIVNDKDILRLQTSVDFPVVYFSNNISDDDSGLINEDSQFQVLSDDVQYIKRFEKFRSELKDEIDFKEPLTRALNALEHIHYNGISLTGTD